MRERILRKFEKLEAMKKELTDAISGLPDERLHRHPAPGKWTAAQVMEHVRGAEERSLDYIRKKTSDPSKVPPAGLSSQLRTFALTFALATPLRFKAPDVVANVPEHPDVAELLARWDDVRSQLKDAIESLPNELLGRAVLRHAVAGRMNLSQALDFMISHFRHHRKQIDRALA